jgi:hypothetical protein
LLDNNEYVDYEVAACIASCNLERSHHAANLLDSCKSGLLALGPPRKSNREIAADFKVPRRDMMSARGC